MSITDPDEAVTQFVERLRSTLRCISEVPLVAQPTDSNLFHIIPRNGQPVELRTERGHSNLKLSIVHQRYPDPHPQIAGAYTVSSSYYAYEILDLDEAEILTYHWHPDGSSPVVLPHLHLSSKLGAVPVTSQGQSTDEVNLTEMHILTGRVLLEDIVRMLITEFRVNPLTESWEDRLFENTEAFRSDRMS